MLMAYHDIAGSVFDGVELRLQEAQPRSIGALEVECSQLNQGILFDDFDKFVDIL